MFKRLATLVMILFNAYHRRREHQLAFMAFQIQMLRRRLDTERIIPSVDERRELIALGAKFDHEVDDLLEIVTPATYRRWLGLKAKGKTSKQVGRKPSEGELVEIVLRMHAENPGWGYVRIKGELKKLGIAASHATVKAIIERHSTEPNPDGSATRKKPISTWEQFIAMHIDSLVGCDFLSKTVLTVRGKMQAFVLVFIHYGSRRVFVTPATYNPDNIWLEQQVRNLSWWCQDEGIEPRYLIRDNDGKFQGSFDTALKQIGMTAVKTSIAAPNMNPVSEAWIGRAQAECLDYFVCVSLQQLNRITQTFARFYNEHRPSQSRVAGNSPLSKNFQAKATGEVKWQSWLGGLLRHYYRDSA